MANKFVICVDVDDTLIDNEGQPIQPFVDIITAIMYRTSDDIDWIVWSGGGLQYAEYWLNQLQMEDIATPRAKDRRVMVKKNGSMQMVVPDLVIDDEAGWGKVSLILKDQREKGS